MQAEATVVAPAPVAPLAPRAKMSPKITVGDMKTQEVARNVWVCRLPDAVNRDDLLKPIFWTHVARQLRVNDRIEVLSHDGSWYAELIVREVSPLDAIVGLLAFTDFAAVDLPAAEEFRVAWKGPAAKWRITRIEDNATIKDGFASEAAANAWLALTPVERQSIAA